MVMSSFLAGAEMITFFTLPRRCLAASLASVKRPVDSTTTCAPTLGQSISAGSLMANTLIRLPLTTMASASTLTSPLNGPSIDSYFSRGTSALGTGSSVLQPLQYNSTLRHLHGTVRPQP